MYQSANTRLNQTPREERYPYDGQVRVMVNFDPWRLVVTLRGLNLSRTGLCAQLPAATSNETRRENVDAEALLAEGDLYDIQLDHDTSHLPAPLVSGRLVRRARTNAGWELAFTFTASDVGLLGLVHEIKRDSP
ncbi:MAG: hypothetical protein NTY08_09010 [Proteobacteria bacterium]|nr:hypothetical protein [Pseudomonadota bacterium]